MPHTVVHKASPQVVDTVLERFHERGVDAVAVDHPNPIALFVSFGTYRVRIAVPEEEAEEARQILDEWDREAATRLGELELQMRRQFRNVTLIVLVAGALLYLVGFRGRLHWVLLLLLPLWFGLLMAVGAYQRARRRSERSAREG